MRSRRDPVEVVVDCFAGDVDAVAEFGVGDGTVADEVAELVLAEPKVVCGVADVQELRVCGGCHGIRLTADH